MTVHRKSAFILCILSFSVALGPLSKIYLARNANHYWTNITMKEDLSAGSNYFEMYLTGERLEEVLRDGRLFIVKDGESIQLVEQDIALRLNRYLEATRYDLLYSGILLTIGLISLGFLISTFFNRSRAAPETS